MTRVLERDSQLAALRSYAEEARGGDGRMALISGEAGIGKSTLIEELEATLPDATWWWGACDGLSTPRALGPLTDIAAQAGGALYAACHNGSSRDARFDALLNTLQDGVALRVLVIEDLHWADEATLDMLRFLGRRIRGARVLVLLTYRDDALAPDEALRVTLGDLATHRSTRRVALGPLSEQAVGQLAEASGLEPRELYELTGGSPFFVAEVLAAGSLGVPSSARDVVLARAAALTPEARGVLDHAALMGARITPALLSAASEHVDELITSGLLVRDRDALRFRHEIARQAVQEEVAPHKATELHRAVLNALLATGCTDDVHLAFHADGAGDTVRVLEHAPRAGHAAAAVASHREAAAQFERAVRYAGSTDVETRAALFEEYANELGLVERWEDAAVIGRAAIDLWREAGNQLREGAAETRFGTVMWRLCRGTESVAAYRRARHLLEPLGRTEELCRLYAGGGGAVDPDGVTLYITRAVEIARELDLADLRIGALNSVAYLAAGRRGDYETPLREALQLSLGLDLQRRAGQSYANRPSTTRKSSGWPRPSRSSARHCSTATTTMSPPTATARGGTMQWRWSITAAGTKLCMRRTSSWPTRRRRSTASRRWSPSEQCSPGAATRPLRSTSTRWTTSRRASTSRAISPGPDCRSPRRPGSPVTRTPPASDSTPYAPGLPSSRPPGSRR